MQESIHIIQKTIDTYKKPVFFYNGGKESVVLLDLISRRLPIVYIKSPNEFVDMVEFVSNTPDRVFECSFHEALQTLHHEGCDAVVFGARSSDPPYVREHFSMADGGWPQITRILPLLNWSYHDVWSYIDTHSLDYCSLYKRGYTSLDDTCKTFRNWHLFDGTSFKHARELHDASHERSGRISTALPISVVGLVEHGRKMGREIGYRTANISCPDSVLDGVYGGVTILNNRLYLSVVSVGVSVNHENRTLESHLLDYSGDDFYTENIQVWLYTYIRPMVRVSSLDEVKLLIDTDVKIFNF